MAVFTPVTFKEVQAFLARYALADLARLEPILAGVENTNYQIVLDDGQRFALTLFERHQDGADLPFVLGFAAHLAALGFPSAHALPDRTGHLFSRLQDRPAALVRWVAGQGLDLPSAIEAAEAGSALARMHDLARGFAPRRENPFGPVRWDKLLARCQERAVAPEWAQALDALQAETQALRTAWPKDLPAGPIHADYFPDNVLFAAGTLSGVIDFGFACTDFFAYDLAIALNAWGFDHAGRALPDVLEAFMMGYGRSRAVTAPEAAALPVLLRGAALRFALSRLHDQLFHNPDWRVIPKDPRAFFRRLAYFQAQAGALPMPVS